MKFSSATILYLLAAFSDTVALAKNDGSQSLRGNPEEETKSDSLAERHLQEEPTDIELAARKASNAPNTRRVLVKYKEGSKKPAVYAMDAANKQRPISDPEIKVEFAFDELNTFVVTATEQEIATLQASPSVESVTEDPIRTPMAIENSNKDLSKYFVKGTRKLAEDIPYGIDLVQAPDVWSLGHTGQGVRVCVLDTGIDSQHPDFITDNLFGNDDLIPSWTEDECGHGTHVSGTVAAQKDNDEGVVGVAPDSEVFTVKVFGNNCGYVYASGIYDAAKQCKDAGAQVISMSLGGPLYSEMEELGFQNLFADDDILVIAAAGNDGNTAMSYPASYSSVMSVGAVAENRQHASFSQRNSQVDIAAPGVGVLSTFPVGGCRICRWNRSGYGSIDGTSMATPHVSGVAALLWSAKPNTSASQMRSILESSAQDLGTPGRDDRYGYGLVQAKDALNLLNGETPPTDPIEEECTSVEGWYDADGPQYNCNWYSQGTRCAEYGDRFPNRQSGLTANDACCACGGGNKGDNDDSNKVCKDFDGWHDSFSDFYDCDWYSNAQNCERFGDDFANGGNTAKDACCACGGGRLE